MGFFALAMAAVAAVCAVLPAPWMFVGMGMGIFAMGAGVVGYRQRDARAASRLSGAAALTLAIAALALTGVRYWTSLTAIDKLENML